MQGLEVAVDGLLHVRLSVPVLRVPRLGSGQGALKQLTVRFVITVSVSGAWLPSLVLCNPESSAPGRWQLIWGKTLVVLSSACEEPALCLLSQLF